MEVKLKDLVFPLQRSSSQDTNIVRQRRHHVQLLGRDRLLKGERVLPNGVLTAVWPLFLKVPLLKRLVIPLLCSSVLLRLAILTQDSQHQSCGQESFSDSDLIILGHHQRGNLCCGTRRRCGDVNRRLGQSIAALDDNNSTDCLTRC